MILDHAFRVARRGARAAGVEDLFEARQRPVMAVDPAGTVEEPIGEYLNQDYINVEQVDAGSLSNITQPYTGQSRSLTKQPVQGAGLDLQMVGVLIGAAGLAWSIYKGVK